MINLLELFIGAATISTAAAMIPKGEEGKQSWIWVGIVIAIGLTLLALV